MLRLKITPVKKSKAKLNFVHMVPLFAYSASPLFRARTGDEVMTMPWSSCLWLILL